jgi:hypothetical protein
MLAVSPVADWRAFGLKALHLLAAQFWKGGQKDEVVGNFDFGGTGRLVRVGTKGLSIA